MRSLCATSTPAGKSLAHRSHLSKSTLRYMLIIGGLILGRSPTKMLIPEIDCQRTRGTHRELRRTR
eukprot:11023955-Prorocentrum_lima.AAC.1